MNIETDKDERYWEQWARANWLMVKDKNSNFFHKFASQRRSWNRIRTLKDADGCILTEEAEMGNLARDFFMNLFQLAGT